jgi:hypothetical protein
LWWVGEPHERKKEIKKERKEGRKKERKEERKKERKKKERLRKNAIIGSMDTNWWGYALRRNSWLSSRSLPRCSESSSAWSIDCGIKEH